MKTSPTVLVLGAGRGSRYHGGRHKLAEDLGATSVLCHTIQQALAAHLPVVVVTTAPFVEAAAQWVARRDIVVLGGAGGLAPGGMGDSIAAGVAARPGSAGWLVLPADMPLIRPETIRAVAAQLAHHPLAYPQWGGERGHPVGFGAELFSDLVRLSGEEGARRLLARYPAHAVPVDDPGVRQDIDTVDDLARVREAWSQGQASLPMA